MWDPRNESCINWCWSFDRGFENILGSWNSWLFWRKCFTLPDDHNVSKIPLKNLTKLLKYNEVLKDYNKTSCDYVETGIVVKVLKDEIYRIDIFSLLVI